MPFIIEIPDINNYLQANLNNFFIAHECLKVEFKNLDEKEVLQNAKGRTVVKGFNLK